MVIYPSMPNGYVTFSDDIRHEMGGKITTVGAYAGEMTILSAAPALIPQLCISVHYREDVDVLPKDVLIIVLQKGTDEVELAKFEATIPAPSPTEAPVSTSDNRVYAELRLEARISPFQVTEDCRISVRAYQGDDEIRLGSLAVKLGAPADSEASTQTQSG